MIPHIISGGIWVGRMCLYAGLEFNGQFGPRFSILEVHLAEEPNIGVKMAPALDLAYEMHLSFVVSRLFVHNNKWN